MYMPIMVIKARKLYHVKYPDLYADADKNKNAKEFNCVQRGHQNSLENLPMFLSLLFTTACRYPISASVLGLVYNLGRLLYFNGYSLGDPQKRYRGGFNNLAILGLMVMCGNWAYELLI